MTLSVCRRRERDKRRYAGPYHPWTSCWSVWGDRRVAISTGGFGRTGCSPNFCQKKKTFEAISFWRPSQQVLNALTAEACNNYVCTSWNYAAATSSCQTKKMYNEVAALGVDRTRGDGGDVYLDGRIVIFRQIIYIDQADATFWKALKQK